MLGSPLYKPFIKALEDETSKKDDHLKIFFDPLTTLEKVIFQYEEIYKSWSYSKNVLDQFGDANWIWTPAEHLELPSENICQNLTLKKFSILYERGGSPQKKLPKIQPSFDRAPQNKWSPRTSP